MSSWFKEGCDKSIYKSQAQYRTGQNDLHNFDFSQFHKTSAIYLRDPANLSCILLYPIVRDKPPTWAWTCTDFSRSSRSSYILASTTILPCPRTFSRCLKIQWRKIMNQNILWSTRSTPSICFLWLEPQRRVSLFHDSSATTNRKL